MQAFMRSPEESLLSDAFGGILSIGVTPGTGGSDALAEDEATQNQLHPWAFCITTKVRSLKPEAKARVDKALADSIEKGEPLSETKGTYRANDYRLETYEVVRALNHLANFCEQFRKREPFSLTGELPTGSGGILNGRAKRRHEAFNDCDYVLALLLFMCSSGKTSNDPLLWAMLTTPTEEYQAQFDSSGMVPAPSAQALAEQLQGSKLYRMRLEGGVKPESLSTKMVQSGMSDRAFFSCDKYNAFLNATGDLEELRVKIATPRIRHWEFALSAAADLHRSCTMMGRSYSMLAQSLRKSTRPNYWPFRKPDPETKKVALEPVGVSLSRWMLRIANLCDSASANVRNTLTSDIVQDLVVQCLYNNALESSSAASEVTLCCRPEHSLPVRASHKVENSLTNVLQNGDGGIDALDWLEQIDDDISVLHDAVDESTEAFRSHAEEIQRANRERLRQHLEEVVVNQKLQWGLFIMTMGDLQSSLENDEEFANLLDEDELPIFAMNPVQDPQVVAEAEQQMMGGRRSASPARSPSPGGGENKRSSSPSAPQPLVSPAMAATAKPPSSPTTVPRTGIDNTSPPTRKPGLFSSLLSGNNSGGAGGAATASGGGGGAIRRAPLGTMSREEEDLMMGNPFDVPLTMADHLQGADNSDVGTEMTEVASTRPSWRQLYEHDRLGGRGGKKPADDPFRIKQ